MIEWKWIWVYKNGPWRRVKIQGWKSRRVAGSHWIPKKHKGPPPHTHEPNDPKIEKPGFTLPILSLYTIFFFDEFTLHYCIVVYRIQL